MKQIYISGGPGLPEYLSGYFGPSSDRLYFHQKDEQTDIHMAVNELVKVVRPFEEYVLIGHSWGGVIALEFIRHNLSDGLKGLVLVSAPLSYRSQKEFEDECVRRHMSPPTLEDIFLSTCEKLEADCVRQLRSIMQSFNPQAIQNNMGYLCTFDHFTLLDKLEIPSLVIYGDDEVRVPAHVQRTYGQNKENFTHFEMREAGHFPFFRPQDLQAVQKKINQFIERL